MTAPAHPLPQSDQLPRPLGPPQLHGQTVRGFPIAVAWTCLAAECLVRAIGDALGIDRPLTIDILSQVADDRLWSLLETPQGWEELTQFVAGRIGRRPSRAVAARQ